MTRSGIGVALAMVAALAAVSGCARKPADRPFGAHQLVEHALRGDLYNLPKGADRLPDFTKLPRKATVFTHQLNGPPRNDVLGFEGVTDRNEWFALDYHSKLKVERGGTYGFRLFSDDGSRLLIDGRVVVDNDGVHPPRSAAGSTELSAGDHTVEIQYFKGPHWVAALQVYCTAPGGSEALFPDCGGLTLETPKKVSDHLWWMWLVGLVAAGSLWWALQGRKPG